MFSAVCFCLLLLYLPLFVENSISNGNRFQSEYNQNVTTISSTAANAITTKKAASNDPFIRWIEKVKSIVSKKLKKFVITEEMIDLAFKIDEAELNEQCIASFAIIQKSLSKYETWSLRMMDSSGKFPGGMFYGSMSSLGNYDECLDVVAKRSNKVEFIGQYCAINYQMYRPKSYDIPYLSKELKKAKYFSKINSKYSIAEVAIAIRLGKFRVGFCFPSSCNVTDVSKMVKILSEHYSANGTLEWCETIERYHKFDHKQRIIFIVISVSVGLIALFTIIDSICPLIRKPKWKYSFQYDCQYSNETNIFALFSFTKNIVEVLSTKSSDKNISFMAGMRFLSMTWVIAVHTYIIQHLFIVGNIIKLRDVPKQFIFQIFMNGTLATESFLFYSGFVVSYTLFKKQENFKFISNLIYYYLNRILRLTAITCFVIALCIILPPFGSGPLWSEMMNSIAANCRENWWKTLLMYTNFQKIPEMCLPHSWFTSMESQLFFLVPFATIALLRAPKIGLFLCFFGIVSSVINIGYQTIINNYPPVPIFRIKNAYYFEELQKYVENVLLNPITHLSPYCIAICSAYIISKPKFVKLSNGSLIFGWITSITVKLVILFTVYIWNSGRDAGTTFTVSYAATCRTIWALSLAWDTIACAASKCGVLTKILSWSFFIPLSRVSLAAYLLNPLLIAVFIGSIRKPYYFSHFLMFNRFFSFLVTSYLAAFVITALIDLPLKKLIIYLINVSIKYGKHSSHSLKSYENECKHETNTSDEKCARNHASFDQSKRNGRTDFKCEIFTESKLNEHLNNDNNQNIEMKNK